MTLRHVIDFYMDGFKAVSFCKVCSKEQDELLQECTGPIAEPVYPFVFENISREEAEKRFPRALKMLDDKKRNG